MSSRSPRALILSAARILREAGVPDAAHDAAALLAHLTGGEALALRLDTDAEVPAETAEAFDRLIRRRAERIPLQHLTGTQLFCGRLFRTDARALIPRPETEELVRRAAAELSGCSEGTAVLDLCCGSGCIGLTVALDCPGVRVTCADLSADALSLARENAARLGADVTFLQGDLFEPCGDETYRMILSNPPYIPTAVCQELQPEVRRDPLMALDGGADGLDFYRRIVREAPAHLLPGGSLLMEIGADEGETAAGLMRAAGFAQVQVYPDLAGRPRMVRGVRL